MVLLISDFHVNVYLPPILTQKCANVAESLALLNEASMTQSPQMNTMQE